MHCTFIFIGMLETPKCYLLLSKILKLYFIIHITKETELPIVISWNLVYLQCS